jgi:hypothetical protein
MNSAPGHFGITISCYRGDLPLVKGCCASIRAHRKEIPICLITDGSVPVDDLKGLYGVSVLGLDDVDPKLRVSYGYGLTKMIAFWHSPFERFMHIDSDAVWWGDVLKNLPWQDYDFIYNEPHEVITPSIQRSQYFNPEKLFSFVSRFAWERRPYFNSGCFVARRGILDLNEYLSLLEVRKKDSDIFMCGEQGILNYMIFKGIADGTISARSWPLQAVVPVIDGSALERRFRIEHGKPVVGESEPRVIHWAGPKPYLIGAPSFPEPMKYYRMQHLRNSKSLRKHLGSYGLICEEIATRLAVHYNGSIFRYLRSRIASAAGRRRVADRV